MDRRIEAQKTRLDREMPTFAWCIDVIITIAGLISFITFYRLINFKMAFNRTGMSYLISLNPLHLGNIAQIGSYRSLKNLVEI